MSNVPPTRWGPTEDDGHGNPVPHATARRTAGGFAWSSLDSYVCGHGGWPTVDQQTDAAFLERGPLLDLGVPACREMIVAAGGHLQDPPAWLGEMELLDATTAGDVARMDALLRAGSASDAVRFGRCAVTAAVHGKRLDLVSWLVARGARPATWSEPIAREIGRVLFGPARSVQGWEGVFEELVAAGMDMRGRAGADAVLVEKDPRVVARLLALGADPRTRDARRRRPYGEASAVVASTELVGLFIAAGVELDVVARDGHTAVHCAVESGHAPALRALLAAGADPDLAQMPSYLKQFGGSFATPVERARELMRDPVKRPVATEMVELLEQAPRRA